MAAVLITLTLSSPLIYIRSLSWVRGLSSSKFSAIEGGLKRSSSSLDVGVRESTENEVSSRHSTTIKRRPYSQDRASLLEDMEGGASKELQDRTHDENANAKPSKPRQNDNLNLQISCHLFASSLTASLQLLLILFVSAAFPSAHSSIISSVYSLIDFILSALLLRTLLPLHLLSGTELGVSTVMKLLPPVIIVISINILSPIPIPVLLSALGQTTSTLLSSFGCIYTPYTTFLPAIARSRLLARPTAHIDRIIASKTSELQALSHQIQSYRARGNSSDDLTVQVRDVVRNTRDDLINLKRSLTSPPSMYPGYATVVILICRLLSSLNAVLGGGEANGHHDQTIVDLCVTIIRNLGLIKDSGSLHFLRHLLSIGLTLGLSLSAVSGLTSMIVKVTLAAGIKSRGNKKTFNIIAAILMASYFRTSASGILATLPDEFHSDIPTPASPPITATAMAQIFLLGCVCTGGAVWALFVNLMNEIMEEVK